MKISFAIMDGFSNEIANRIHFFDKEQSIQINKKIFSTNNHNDLDSLIHFLIKEDYFFNAYEDRFMFIDDNIKTQSSLLYPNDYNAVLQLDSSLFSNGSIAALVNLKYELEWCKDCGEYYCAIEDDEIIAVGGCHPLPEIDKNGWRINFRGCELPRISPYKGLNKGNWNTITWRDFIPVFIDYCPTNIDL